MVGQLRAEHTPRFDDFPTPRRFDAGGPEYDLVESLRSEIQLFVVIQCLHLFCVPHGIRHIVRSREKQSEQLVLFDGRSAADFDERTEKPRIHWLCTGSLPEDLDQTLVLQ